MEYPLLQLEEALEDLPKIHQSISIFNLDCQKLNSFSSSLREAFSEIVNSQLIFCRSVENLISKINSFSNLDLILGRFDSRILLSFNQYASYLQELCTTQHAAIAQMNDSVIYRFDMFSKGELKELEKKQQVHRLTKKEYETSMDRYMKLSKKCSEPQRCEAVEDVFQMKKKYHQTSLELYSQINITPISQRLLYLESMQAHLQATFTGSKMHSDVCGKDQLDEFLVKLSKHIQTIQLELYEQQTSSEELSSGLLQNCLTGAGASRSLYLLEDIERSEYDSSLLLPSTSSVSKHKSGYLMMRTKHGLLQSSVWERIYCFLEAGNLLGQRTDELAGHLLVDISCPGVKAEVAELDERRHVFQIIGVQSNGKSSVLLLQAENHNDMMEWMAAINLIAVEGDYVKADNSVEDNSVVAESVLPKFVRHMQGLVHSLSKESAEDTHSSAATLDLSVIENTPIQFDLQVPFEAEPSQNVGAKCTTPAANRYNPFVASGGGAIANTSKIALNAAFASAFPARFHGSMQVPVSQGVDVVHATIRCISAARAHHNIFKMAEVSLLISSDGAWLLEPGSNQIRLRLSLDDVTFWCAHEENKRLFGFISRSIAPDSSCTFTCHVCELDVDADELCLALQRATQLARQQGFPGNESRTRSETDIILENINRLEDKTSSESPQSPEPSELPQEAADWLQENT